LYHHSFAQRRRVKDVDGYDYDRHPLPHHYLYVDEGMADVAL
jgi:hypothetical protein